MALYAPLLRKADFWVRLPAKPVNGRVSISAAELAEGLSVRLEQLACLRVVEMTLVSYFCERFPVCLCVDGELGDSLNTVIRAGANDKCWAVLFGVSQDPHPHAVALDRHACIVPHNLSRGVVFSMASTRGVGMPADAGFQVRIGVIAADRGSSPTPPAPPLPASPPPPPAVIRKAPKSPAMQRVRSTPEVRRPYTDYDSTPEARGWASARDSEWSEGDLPTAYEYSSDATAIRHGTSPTALTTTETSATSSSTATTPKETSSSSDDNTEAPKHTVDDTPPPHHRRSGSGALRSSRGIGRSKRAVAGRAKDLPSPSSSTTDVFA